MFVKEVVEGPMMGMEVTMDRFGLEKGSARVRLRGDIPLMESMEVAGDTPLDAESERRFRGYSVSVGARQDDSHLHMNFERQA